MAIEREFKVIENGPAGDSWSFNENLGGPGVIAVNQPD